MPIRARWASKKDRKSYAPYKSNFEKRIAESLRDRKVKFTYEEHKFDYTLRPGGSSCLECGSRNVVVHHWYVSDFSLYLRGKLAGPTFFIETKGKFTPKDQKKMLAVRAAHPEIEVRFVFYRDQKLSKHSERRYSDWCNTHGFQYAIGEVPEEWVTKKKRSKRSTS